MRGVEDNTVQTDGTDRAVGVGVSGGHNQNKSNIEACGCCRRELSATDSPEASRGVLDCEPASSAGRACRRGGGGQVGRDAGHGRTSKLIDKFQQ